MIHREIGRTGITASVIGFGGMRFFKHPEEQAVEVVRRCVDLGVTFFETGSYGEGQSEEVLGRALKGLRDKVTLANKAAVPGLPDGAKIRERIEETLRREQVDYFDLFSFWGLNTREMFENLKGADRGIAELEKAKRQGLIRAIGLTSHAEPDQIVEFLKEYPFDCVTLKEHVLYSRQQGTIDFCRRNGIGVVVMSPLAGGIVAQPSPEIRERLAQSGYTAATLGLRYLVANPGVTSAITGVETVADVEENVKAGDMEGPLTEEEQGLIAFIREKMSAIGENFCTQCGYCMPCPEGVNIPGIFRLWNIMRGFGAADYSRLEYGNLCKQSHWGDFSGRGAEACVECGQCEEKCPNNLPIIEDLKRAHADLSPES